ncbi:unnamed protein product [Didymodactylos carnosus]|uniref:Innexin n=1 Tax=Didymodactylos carnosus TaxID=1234261 RepID=A0A814SLN0_9BILA|nr:unnamed protein product [Didymodactylos carnosus]CAF1149879.1 unnamed protein product [Didymodactylos carnosus]CAF3524487.1 unnamed protein product [Didymodactylos carnosus]CAF3913438.1 unnamed protein product [Didymodactylos carnosus]
MANKIINIATKLPFIQSIRAPDNDDFHNDRLNHRFTAGLLICFAVITSTTSCWIPAQLRRDGYTAYIESYCWISSTYYIHINNTIPLTEDGRKQALLGYYQWIPFILLLIAFCFYLPRMLWRSMNTRSGMDIQSFIKDGHKSSKHLIPTLQRYCHFNYTNHGKYGNYLTILYFITKMFYLTNSIVQFVLLNIFLGYKKVMIDYSILETILAGNPLKDSYFFPRVTLCDLKIREIGIVHRYTIQCVLPVNMLNEKIFIILWFWFVYVMLDNIIEFLIIIKQVIDKRGKLQYIKRLCNINNGITDISSGNDEPEQRIIQKFTFNYLMGDGLFIIRLLSKNVSEMVAADVVTNIFKSFRKKEKEDEQQRDTIHMEELVES